MPVNTPQTFNVASGFKFKGGGGGPSGMRIEHRVGIQAPSDVIWDVLYDLEGWSKWNPLYPQASGQIRIGSTLTMSLALPDEEPRVIHPVVLEWVPREQLHWRLKMLGGLVSNTRYIEIEQLADESCIVSNGELFGGFLGPRVAQRMGRKVWRGFEAMSLALKQEAETRWRAGKAAPTSDA
ncbi:MAG: SRPBCC family protein [Phenylobacterium sp.]|uniref:SRPBCC family protein n=1 Tax=Phenylobacterium sp. TaxID=1871053 RepID=UPI00391D0D9B